jgi:putative membrane protein
MKAFLCWALVITGFIYSACDEDSDTTIAAADRTFIAKAAEANQSEIEIGELAASKATSVDVQAYGQKMATEHQAALDELRSIADSKGVVIPGVLNESHNELKKRLENLEQGLEFDTAYMNSQVKDHELTESFFQVEIDQGTDEDVKGYANDYLPHIQMHRQEAETLLIILEP